MILPAPYGARHNNDITIKTMSGGHVHRGPSFHDLEFCVLSYCLPKSALVLPIKQPTAVPQNGAAL